ncbi:uncharacterized protein LOC129565092 [Sitodiplosis mosellana]|uniref:uncharacterized protein LOC129565092 n=1 Tax=Sitodiplosis mosellana TaxID=263140 RepID=UPI00244397AF|nr:uncharacterized protein LOC129565092 [Sitodiplosis mosellana]
MTEAEPINVGEEPNVQNDSSNDDNKFLTMMALAGETVLGWLCLKDLVSVNTTCKQLKKQTEEHFLEHYPWQSVHITQYRPRKKLELCFNAQFRNVVVHPGPEVFDRMISHHNKRVHCLEFHKGEIAEIDNGIIAGIVKNVRIIKITGTTFDGELYECLLKHCTHMEHLIIIKNDGQLKECTQRGTKNQWLLQSYPSLKQFYLVSKSIDAPENLKIFFRLNPNVRTFHSGNGIFMHTVNILMANEWIHFDELHLDIAPCSSHSLRDIVSNLNQLYDNQQYKRLFLNVLFYVNILDAEWWQVKGLYGFSCLNADSNVFEALMKVNQIRMLFLRIGEVLSHDQAVRLAKNFHNLEEINLRITDINQITPFISHAVNVKKIYVDIEVECLMNLDLDLLDEERKKLKNANKIEMYLRDSAYFEMKWKFSKINYNLIEIKRRDDLNALNSFAVDEMDWLK